ncbi:ComEC/Rec2 family competence protein [uncultured Campylobacter sp.]|uniref:ComEC/Rec2 family competence protein n=1 Tax=uncultured Campylobacter sp. TaxID=218934 RepID=UPI0026311ECA|nr:ComEC/Rec2 family competence protein [uncultured Campylobacter sp.]
MKLQLFYRKREILYFLLILLGILSINLGVKFYELKEFRAKNYAFYDAQLLNAYAKTNERGRTYTVLKLKTADFTLYTTAGLGREFHRFARVNIGIVTKNVKFLDFLKQRFYAPNFKISAETAPSGAKWCAISFVRAQHEDEMTADLYSALYFATEISKPLRASVTNWGIAHIISISGFHLGIIFSTVFLLAMPIYRYFQDRYFPYRSAKRDLSVFVIVLMSGYLFVLDFTPSFLRSLAMCCVGFYLAMRNFYVLKFTNLFLTIALLLAFFPHLAFSIGFYFSCLGVLYIFLYLHHFAPKFKLWQNVILFNLYVWLSMNVAVYYFFPTASLQQLSVMPLGYVFVIFYPLSIFLHLFGLGGALDTPLLAFLNFALPSFQAQIPPLLLALANICALAAIKLRYAAVACAIIGISPIFFIT